MKMKTVSITGTQQVELRESEIPVPKENLVQVKIHVAPMCTEYKAYQAGQVNDYLGHEAAGEVTQIAQPGAIKVGDRVVVMPQYPCGKCPLCLRGEYIHCQHCIDVAALTGKRTGTATYAQYLLKQDWLLVPIPEEISYEHASMACCGLGPTFGAMQLMNVDGFDTVLITGMGPVGLGGVINGVQRGARVFAVESHPYRAELARTLGAEVVFDPNDDNLVEKILEMTNGVGVDKGIDCAGVAPAQRLLIDTIRRKGEVTFVGEGGEVSIHVSRDTIRKGLTLRGSWHYNLADTPRIMKIIRESSKSLDNLITHKFSLGEVQKAWDLQLTGDCGKILLYPWQ
jgi:L-iditol 2-dehydrogenase